MIYDGREIDDMSPVYGEYGMYGCYVYPEELLPADEDYLDEQWAAVDEDNGYWVSTCGRVWSSKTEKFLKLKRLDKHGHLGISISTPGHKDKYRYIHRLMAEAFLCKENEDQTVVRYLDDDPTNNFIGNLAWGTQKDNMSDCIDHDRFYYLTDDDRYKGNKDRMIRVIVTDTKTGKVERYNSLNEAARATGVQQSNAWKVLYGLRAHAGGFIFEKEE